MLIAQTPRKTLKLFSCTAKIIQQSEKSNTAWRLDFQKSHNILTPLPVDMSLIIVWYLVEIVFLCIRIFGSITTSASDLHIIPYLELWPHKFWIKVMEIFRMIQLVSVDRCALWAICSDTQCSVFWASIYSTRESTYAYGSCESKSYAHFIRKPKNCMGFI